MENSLDSILSEEPVAPVVQEPVAETPLVQEAQETQGAGEDTGTPPEPQKDDPLEKHRKGLEAAATAERRKRQEAEDKAARLQQELEAFKRSLQPPQQVQQPRQDDGKPLRSQFATEDEWLDARDEWRDTQRQKQAEAEKQEAQAREQRVKSESVIAEAMKLEGFDLQAFARVPVTDHMYDAILESEVAAKLVHFLQTNPAEAERIAGLSKAGQLKEMVRIEDKLAATPTPPTEEKPVPQLPKTLTQARSAKGQFEAAYSGPTPLNAILASK